MARRLDISADDVYGLHESARAQHFVSIDSLNEKEPALGNVLAAADHTRPGNRLEKAEMLEQLTEAMQQLDLRRLQIIVLNYYQHLTMKQIADLLEVTESRVGQSHARALANLSTMLGEYHDGGR